MYMTHRTSGSQLKAHMGRYMKAVRAGGEVVVTDRGQPVARLVPFRAAPADPEALPLARPRDPAAAPLAEVEVRPIRYRGTPTSALLAADRKRR